MIKDVRVYPWNSFSGKEFILTKIFTTESSYSAISPLIANDFLKCKKDLSSIRTNITGMPDGYADSIDEMIEDMHQRSDIDPGLLLSLSVSLSRAATGGNLWSADKIRDKMVFPYVMLSVIRGRVSGSGTDWKSFMLVPRKVLNPNDMRELLSGLWSDIGTKLSDSGKISGKDMDNRWVSVMNTEETLEFLSCFCDDYKVDIAVDCGSWRMEKSNIYRYRNEDKKLSEEKQLEFVSDMCKRFNIRYLENPFRPSSLHLSEELNRTINNTKLIFDMKHENEFGSITGSDIFSMVDSYNEMFFNLSEMKDFVNMFRKDDENKSAQDNKSIKSYENTKHAKSIKSYENTKPGKSIKSYANTKPGKNIKEIILSSGEEAIPDPWIADVAIAFRVPYIKTTPTEGQSILNRLSELWLDVPNETM